MDNGFAGDKTSSSSRSLGDLLTADAATRRLCAGTYLDRELRQRLLRNIYNSRGRRVAPSYGYNLVQVLRHAWRAWWLDLTRDAVAVALCIFAVLTVPLGTLFTIELVALWYALRAGWRIMAQASRMLLERKSYDDLRGLRVRAKLVAFGLLGSIVVAGGTVLAMLFILEGSRLREELIQTGRLVALFILLFAVIGVIRQRQLDQLHDPSAVKGAPRSPRLQTLDRQQNHPVTVYSGYRPFVGSGFEVHRWSFAQRIIRERKIGQSRDEEFHPSRPPFKTSEIVGHLKASIQRLASDTHSETRLPGLVVRNRVFIDGTYINNVLGALSYPPSPDVMDDIMANPREEARYHIESQVMAWGGELVTTVFVHISLQGRTLYVDFSTHALFPTPRRFRVIDEVGGTGTEAVLRMARQSLSEIPDVLHAPRRLVAAPKLLVSAHRAQRDIKENVKRHDIGAQISAREVAGYDIDNNSDEAWTPRRARQNPEDASYFQLLDVTRHSKIVERRLLSAIEEFLKAKQVDTSEFTQRVEAILNYGMMNIGPGGTNTIGGDFNAG